MSSLHHHDRWHRSSSFRVNFSWVEGEGFLGTNWYERDQHPSPLSRHSGGHFEFLPQRLSFVANLFSSCKMLNQHDKECRCLVLANTRGKARKVEMQVPGGKAGCRWKSPAWYPSLDSAPQVTSPACTSSSFLGFSFINAICLYQVEISEDRLVTIAWTEEQLMENRACTDLFEVKDFFVIQVKPIIGRRRDVWWDTMWRCIITI